MAGELGPQQHAGGEQSSGKKGCDHSEGVLPTAVPLETYTQVSAVAPTKPTQSSPQAASGASDTHMLKQTAKCGKPLTYESGLGFSEMARNHSGAVRGARCTGVQGGTGSGPEVTRESWEGSMRGPSCPRPLGDPAAEGTHTPTPRPGGHKKALHQRCTVQSRVSELKTL